ncbi:hypothetical protein IRP63_12090 [Clostridium botulinum]|uniref:Transcription initiation factor TFIIIB n=2 Tax=Clostridium botulinum TaxID=1491 RepID=A0A9Q1UWC6_CLOBO|nr:hypothetical protein [Clostridium botulinum]AEB74979.1 conserved hypothetical protein [Clostridium botulinum BKT015925]KEI02250.1 hypothetical protein Y848_07875 [Clostridium botulinum C/D str. Sp77]KEI03635.1 hypothetical protein Z953_04025 [Clostridium botulinum D str. 16868]KEI06222.1 hypothetical protein Z952_04265 [Clostridium botulinum C/D str. BKT75002]KEI08632.1 hypothetical protein Z954_00990 [Clostridium botulinum C/D str. BKT2873]
MKSVNISKCPYCGGTEFGEGYQSYQANLLCKNRIFKNTPIHHVICINCGSIVRSYVNNPENFKSK